MLAISEFLPKSSTVARKAIYVYCLIVSTIIVVANVFITVVFYTMEGVSTLSFWFMILV